MTHDYFLGLLVEWAKQNIRFAITLSVGGATIAGELTREDEYFEGVAQLVRAGDTASAEDEERISEMLRRLPHIADETAMMHVDEAADVEEMRGYREEMADAYVHLKNTQILLANGEWIDFRGGFWRGKLAAVDGYWLGRSEPLP